jgi:serine protease inhibitor
MPKKNVQYHRRQDTANKLYVQEGFKLLDTFLQTTSKHYHAEAEATNFAEGEAARALINDFVEKKTNGKIKELIKSGILTALTRLAQGFYNKQLINLPERRKR